MAKSYPPEPSDLKKALRALLKAGQEGKYVIFTGNKLPKYLWDSLRSEVKRRGGSWQALLKVLSANYKAVEDWLEDKIKWEELVEMLLESLSETAKPAPEKAKTRKRSILDFLE